MLKLRALRARLYENRFELLMLSLWCVFILNIIFPENIYRGTAQAIYLPIQLLAALVLFEFKPRILRLVLIFGALLLVGRAMVPTGRVANHGEWAKSAARLSEWRPPL